MINGCNRIEIRNFYARNWHRNICSEKEWVGFEFLSSFAGEMKSRIILCIVLIFCFSEAKAQNPLPLDTVLKRAMSVSEKYNGLVESYKAKVYMRTYVETVKKNILYKYTHLIPQFVLHDPKSDQAVIETVSLLKYTYPKHYLLDVKNITGTITNKRDVEMLPFNLLYLNVYGETTNDETFFMPIRFSTSKYYRYKLFWAHEENGKNYYTVGFTPIYENPKLLKGQFVVEEGTWRVVHFSAEGLESFADFSFDISMGDKWITNYLPERFIIYNTASYLGNKVASRHLATIDYLEFTPREQTPAKKTLNISDLYAMRLDSVPVNNDSVFWGEHRTFPLQRKELDVLADYHARLLQKEEEKRKEEVKNGNGRLTAQFSKGLVANTRYKYKSTMIGYSGLFNPQMLGYSSTDGITYRQNISVDFDLKRSRSLQIDAYAGYLFKRKEFYADLTTSWNYDPYFLGSVSFSAGIGNPTYSSLFLNMIKTRLANQGLLYTDLSLNYYQDYYFKIFNHFELFNGFLTTGGLEYHIRTPKDKEIEYSPIQQDGTLVRLLDTRKTFVPYVRLTWTPEQYHRYEGRQKIYVRSRFPTFRIEFARSVKNILGSTSQYNRVELDINQNIPVGLMKSFHYHIGMGKFTNQETEYFADFVFFARTNFPNLWEDGIGGSFNLLSRHLYNASDSYIQAHFMYEAPFLILKNVPFISDYISIERFYLSQLVTPQIKSYTEIGYGIGNRFFNAGIFSSFREKSFKEIGAKASFVF